MTSTKQEHTNWTAAGSDATAQKTYASVRKALEGVEARRNVEIYLQGSYANSTNIRADSDVDIVVMSRVVFEGSVVRLGPTSRATFDELPAASYTGADLRTDVTQALVDYYGSSRVHPHNKCIKIDKRDGYVDADVVPCLQYRWYSKADSNVHRDFIEGIAIHPLRGGRIVNFPKEHIRNGKSKNFSCGGHYKKTVRQIKRLRTRARLARDIAPGYLLECMTFNAPSDRFVSNDSDRLKNVILWLKFAQKQGFFSCDRIHHLFADDPGSFTAHQGQTIVDALWDAL